VAITIADISVNHPRDSVGTQLVALRFSKAIDEAEVYALNLAIDNKRGGLDQPGTLLFSLPLDRGRAVRVHKDGAADRAHAWGETRIEKEERSASEEDESLVQAWMAQTGWDRDRAQQQVASTHPSLWNAHRHALVFPGRAQPPVAKSTAPSYAQIMAEAAPLTQATPDLSTRDALAKLALAHPGERAYWDASRQFHLTDGVQERDQQAAGEPVAKHQLADTYGRMWG